MADESEDNNEDKMRDLNLFPSKQHPSLEVSFPRLHTVKIDNECGRRWVSVCLMEGRHRQPGGDGDGDGGGGGGGGGDGGSGLGVMFLPSLGGTMRSLPALSVQAVCRRMEVPFLRYDATHLGASVMEVNRIPGQVLTLWHDDATHMFVHHVRGDKVVLVGFSLGATIAINLARTFPKRVAGLILCSPLINLTEVMPGSTRLPYLYFLSTTLKTRVTLKELRAFQGDAHKYKFPSHKGAVKIHCPVNIIQGMKDTFPYRNAVCLATLLDQEKVRLELLKEEDHYMQTNKGLRAITATLMDILGHG